MKIENCTEEDLPEIISLINQEFPYVSISIEKIRKKIADGKISLFKAVEGKRLLGFIEAEFLEEGIARINGVTVKPGERNQGIATALVEHTLEFLKKRQVKRIILLVKQGNEEAKSIYRQKGFKFIGLYHREIDQAVVEEMELDLSGEEEKPSYVS
ncbi:MAG: GNAT family N-acetyltransferase [Candidatus Diapherotrites archaeon]|uniref:GNAT family N-acetyltransferase n=1 Tax=Candidatus Iainarchaeum sp. TaxID=3101447 RepID=A0A938YWX6_9ARCH|nr:GNAT family N-acetyltransferase [Candidatus Diapherotrites archaeon]